MIDISGWIYSIFGPYGGWGILLCVFLIFFIDAVIFPTLPELFFMFGFFYQPTLEFGIALLLIASVGEVLGVTILYLIVKKIGVPERIRRIFNKYIDFLVVSDERIFLVNRFAPMIPFSGAFIGLVDRWSYKKCMAYIVLGCYIKYGLILVLAAFFYISFDPAVAQNLSLILIVAVIALSFITSFLKKKRTGVDT